MLHKAIKGFEDYLVTDTGRVYSLKSGGYLKLVKHHNDYLFVTLCKKNERRAKSVHRLVADAFIVNFENKETVDHINRDKTDNRVENLRWADYNEQRENSSTTISCKEKLGLAIIEQINEEVSIGFRTITEVPRISQGVISKKIIKGETDFTIKQKNGNVRHFKVPPKQN